MELTGIILAGGKSSRMGQDKGLMQFHEKQMVQYSIELLNHFTSKIIISSNNHQYKKFGFPVIADIYKNCGPIGGLHAALSVTSTEWNIVISCDAPFVNPLPFQSMLKVVADHDVIIPQHGKGLEPLFGIYNKRIVPFLEGKIKTQEFKLQKILKELNIYLFDISDFIKQTPKLFSNINSPEDFII